MKVIINQNQATDNCPLPKHDWHLMDEGIWECSYCGAISVDEDASNYSWHLPSGVLLTEREDLEFTDGAFTRLVAQAPDGRLYRQTLYWGSDAPAPDRWEWVE